ncbi:Threonine/homoserine efflux transporter RhtA [Aureimonas altamirensis DSM 21988]|uniref:Threonine/homoserine efflux transporter RhtA n=1 Tax=Aureimonas altamirensis DSM 21988 TaxID=1121026 RepID=A0ABY1IQT3_9HYPH|nr:DMT family transporter [Aureimonas altamirensis]SHJ94631.1 Threonine/homoserine efflux transporter RhtA [Aureimonas altamirensis DSM 21988]
MISDTRTPHETERPGDRILARTAPLIFLVLWSSGFGFAKVGLEHAGPMTLLSLRYGAVVTLLIPAFLIRRPALPRTAQAWLHIIIVGFLIQFVYFGLGLTSMYLGVPVGTAAVIASLQPIVVCLAAPAITGERIGGLKWTGILIGLFGAVAVIASQSGVIADGYVALPLCFGSMLAMAAATLYQKRFGAAHHVISVNLVQYTVGFILTLPLSLMLESQDVSWTMEFAVALAYLVIANSLVAISLLLFMLRRGETSRVSSLFFLIPPTAALSGWLLLGETLGPLAVAGMAIAVAGVALVQRS